MTIEQAAVEYRAALKAYKGNPSKRTEARLAQAEETYEGCQDRDEWDEANEADLRK